MADLKSETKVEPKALLSRRLREKGLRVTQQRVAVLEFLLETPRHPTAEEIEAGVNRDETSEKRSFACWIEDPKPA